MYLMFLNYLYWLNLTVFKSAKDILLFCFSLNIFAEYFKFE